MAADCVEVRDFGNVANRSCGCARCCTFHSGYIFKKYLEFVRWGGGKKRCGTLHGHVGVIWAVRLIFVTLTRTWLKNDAKMTRFMRPILGKEALYQQWGRQKKALTSGNLESFNLGPTEKQSTYKGPSKS